MKTLIIIATLVCAATSLLAQPKGDSTKEQFMAFHKAHNEKKGSPISDAKLEEMFGKIDKNKDGIASVAEKDAYWAAQKKPAAKSESKPESPKKKPAEAKSAEPVQDNGITKATFIEMEKVKWKKNGWKFNEAKVVELFNEMDADKDGIASGKERKMYWDKQKK